MKTNLLPLLAAFALTIGTATAQTTTPQTMTTQTAPSGQMDGRGYGRMQANPDEMAKRQSERLTQELGLSADQTTKVQQILLARAQEMQTMRSQAHDAGNRDQMRAQMQANRAKYEEQFKAVLTPDQYTKFTSLEAERMNRGGGRGMGGPGMGPQNGSLDKLKAKTEDGDKLKAKEDKEDKIKAKADKKASKKAKANS